MTVEDINTEAVDNQAPTPVASRPVTEVKAAGEPSEAGSVQAPKPGPVFKTAAPLGAAVLILLCAVIACFAFYKPEKIWASKTVDMVVLGTIITFLATLATSLFMARSSTTDPFRPLFRRAVSWLGALALLLGFFVAYASFRTQSRLAAEETLTMGGYALYEIEMQKPEIRCLYFNYGHENAERCLETLVSSQELWSSAIFYVEEGWFQLSHANDQRDEWGADYAESIRYWAEDVSRDPTGLFAYYLVSSEPTLDKARKTMAAADVAIPDLCRNYVKVWQALVSRKAQPSRVSGAARECGVKAPMLETNAGV